MKNSLLLISSILIFILISSCSSKKKVNVVIDTENVSYSETIAPMIKRSCTPCHFPDRGRKEPLHTYEHVKSQIDHILVRVQLPVGNKKFMPFKQKKQVLSEAEIQLLKNWVANGMPE